MRTALAMLTVALLLTVAPMGQVVANSGGKFNSSGGCGCHGYSSVTAQLNGVPTDYTPGSTYAISVGMGTSPTTGGFNLAVTQGQFSNPDANTRLNSNAKQATHDYSYGTTSWSFDWTAPSAGTGSVRFDLAVLSANGNGGNSGDTYGTTSVTANEAVSNTPPTVNNLAIAPIAPSTTDDLTASYTFSDDDGDAESGTTVAWFRDGAIQSTFTGLTLPASATSDGEDVGTSVASSPVTVLNTAPTVLSVTPSDLAPDTSEDVVLAVVSDDLDGDAVTATETKWMLGGSHVDSLDDATTLPSLATRPGDVWTVEVRVSDGTDLSSWLTSDAITVGSTNQAPVVSNVVIDDGTTPTTGDAIAATWAQDDPDGDSIQSTELQWSKDGTHIVEANDLNPLPASFTAKGETWTVQIRAYDGALWSTWATSAGLTVGNTAPVIEDAHLTSPTLTVQDNLSLNLTSSDVDGDDLSVVSVRWFLDEVEQGIGADQTTLPASALTRGDAWHAVVALSDGTDEVSFTTDAVTVLNSAPTVTVEWPVNVTATQDLVPIILSSDADGDAVSVETSWYKNGFRDATLSNLTSVPANKLAPEQSWRLVVMIHDGMDAGEEVASTTEVLNLNPQANIIVVSNEVWTGEHTLLSGASSVDADGQIVMHRWTVDGQVLVGKDVLLILEEATEVSLTVIDEHGGMAMTSTTLNPTLGPEVQNLEAVHDGAGSVQLTWTWSGEFVTHHVYRNGDMIGVTDSTTFTDRPPMSGVNTYTVQPVSEERTFQRGADDVGLQVNDVEIVTPAPAAGLGYGLGGAMILVLLLLQILTLRSGGGRT
jgi:hypothetical protein